MSQTASWESLLIPASVCSNNSKQKVEWEKITSLSENITDLQTNHAQNAVFSWVLWQSKEARVRRQNCDTGTSGNSDQPGWNMQQAAGCFYVLCSGLIPAPREGTDLGENFNRHMVQARQTLCCGIWQHTGTSGCLATSSLALRPGTDTWYPVGIGLHHLRQLSVKDYQGDLPKVLFPTSPFHLPDPVQFTLCSLLTSVWKTMDVFKPVTSLFRFRFCVCAISQQRVPTLILMCQEWGNCLFIHLENKV